VLHIPLTNGMALIISHKPDIHRAIRIGWQI
jgi:hypothetical protein